MPNDSPRCSVSSFLDEVPDVRHVHGEDLLGVEQLVEHPQLRHGPDDVRDTPLVGLEHAREVVSLSLVRLAHCVARERHPFVV